MIRAFALAFAWTLAIEIPAYAMALRRIGVAPRDALRLGLAVNLATHPLFSVWVLSSPRGPGALVAAEFVVVLVEGSLLATVLGHRGPCLAAALLANAASLAAGVGLAAAGWL